MRAALKMDSVGKATPDNSFPRVTQELVLIILSFPPFCSNGHVCFTNVRFRKKGKIHLFS